MNIDYCLPLFLVIFCNICYQLLSKNTSTEVNPFFSLVITYAIAGVTSLILFFFTPKQQLMVELSKIDFGNIFMGFVLVGIEGGYLFMYRKGWKISQGSMIASISVSCVLVLIGICFYQEGFSGKKLIGAMCCVMGIVLLH